MTIVLWAEVIVFVAIGLIHLSNIEAIRIAYEDWRYPRRFHFVTGILELAAALLLAMPATRGVGMTLALAICAAAIATLLWHREFAKLAPPILVGAGLLVLGYGLGAIA